MVIDLSTAINYDKNKFLNKGIEYKKLPTKINVGLTESLDKFIKIVDKFLDNNKSKPFINNFKRYLDDKLIGVHCLHGINRTGILKFIKLNV